MHPPTPYPASGRPRSKGSTDRRNKAFSEITERMNVLSRSEQDFSSVLKAEEEMDKKTSTKSTAMRRHSVASKFGSIKPDKINSGAGGTSSLEIQPKGKQVSLQGKAGQPSKSAMKVGNGKSASKGTTVSFWGTTSTRIPAKKQCAVEHASEILKPGDMLKKSRTGVNGGALSAVEVAPMNAESRSAGPVDASPLKSAQYWLEQVQLAESIEKHGVAIGFFQLAVECEAEPIQVLREELLSYKKRYALYSDGIFQAMSCYGVAEESQVSMFPRPPGDMFADSETGSGFREPSSASTSENNAVGNDKSNHLAQQNTGVLPRVVSFKKVLGDETVNEENNDFQRHRVSEESLSVYDTTSQDSKPACARPVETMDVDTLTREVVSYIMSSMDDSIVSPAFRKEAAFASEDNNVTSSPSKENSRVLKISEELLACSEEEKLNSIMTRNSRGTSAFEAGDLDRAESTGSMPSLDVWNTSSIEPDTGTIGVQEIQSITGMYVEATDSLHFNPDQESVQRKENVNPRESFVQENDVPEQVSKVIADQMEFSADVDYLSLDGSPSFRTEGRKQSQSVSNRKLSGDGKGSTADIESPKIVPNCTGSSKKGPGKRTEAIAGNRNAIANENLASCQVNGAPRKPPELNSAQIIRAACKPTVQNGGEDDELGRPPEFVTPKAGRLPSRASFKTPASDPDPNLAMFSKTRSKAGTQNSHSGGRGLGSAVKLQHVNLPQIISLNGKSPAPVTQLPTSSSRSRRGRNQVCAGNGSLPGIESSGAIATPGSTEARRRSARLRPTDSVTTTPCPVTTPRSVLFRRERGGQR